MFWSVDRAGNVENDNAATFVVTPADDTTAPSTVSDVDAVYDTSPAVIHLTAVDNEGGSGVASISYRIDGGATATIDGASAAVVVSGDGPHTIEFWAIDNAGNVETIVRGAFTISGGGGDPLSDSDCRAESNLDPRSDPDCRAESDLDPHPHRHADARTHAHPKSRARLSMYATRTSSRNYQDFTVYGYAVPNGMVGQYVRVQWIRYGSHTWRTLKTVKVRALGNGKPYYSYRFDHNRSTRSGTYYFRAVSLGQVPVEQVASEESGHQVASKSTIDTARRQRW